MNIEESHTSSIRLYGNGLLARLHLSGLPKETRTKESSIRNRWNGLQSSIPAEANIVLTDVHADRGQF